MTSLVWLGQIVAKSKQPAPIRHRQRWMQQDHIAIAIWYAQGQHLRHKGADLARGEIDHGDDLLSHQSLGRIVPDDLGGRALDADLAAEIDGEFECGLARLRKIFRSDNSADPDIDFAEILEPDLSHDTVAA